jgi:hypothetical protein
MGTPATVNYKHYADDDTERRPKDWLFHILLYFPFHKIIFIRSTNLATCSHKC